MYSISKPARSHEPRDADPIIVDDYRSLAWTH